MILKSLVLALAALTLTSCSSASDDGAAHPSAPPASSTGVPASAGAPALAEPTTLKLPGEVGAVRIDAGTLAYPASDRDGAWTLNVTKVSDGKTRTVASSGFDHGLITGAGIAGNWVAYVDQSAVQSDTQPKVLWRVIAMNLETGATTVLDTNGDTPDPYVPSLQSQDHYIFWTSAESDGTAREDLWRPGWAQPKDLLRHVEMTPGSASIDGDELVYLGPSPDAHGQQTVGGDCWQVPLSGGEPVPLTDTALAMSCASTDGTVVYATHIDPETPNPPDDGILDDPYELTARPSGGAAVTLHGNSYFSVAPVVATHGVVLWQAISGKRFVQSVTDPSAKTGLPGSSAGKAVVSNDELAVASTTPDGTVVRVFDLA